MEERNAVGGRGVSSAVIDAIHETVCGTRRQRGEHLNAGENVKEVADKLVRPLAQGWLSKVSCCSHCKRAGKAAAEHAEWSYTVKAPEVELSSDSENDGRDGGTTRALPLVDKIQGLVSGAAVGSGDLETGEPKLCTSPRCGVGVMRRCRAVTGKAPEFFVLRAQHPSESSATPADMRVNFGGKKTLKFPRHGASEGDPPPPEGVYRALCRVEHKNGNHYITKVNIGVTLHHASDEWYSYDALGVPKVTRTEEEGLASEQCFAVFVNMAWVALKEDVVDGSKSLHRVEEHRKSVNADEMTGSAVVARTGARTRGRARRL